MRALTTALELGGVTLIAAAAFIAFGAAAGLAVTGVVLIAASFALTRGSS